MIDAWIAEVKKTADPRELGMILVHNGIVRATTKKGDSVQRMQLSYNKEKLQRIMDEYRSKEGIVTLKVWINEGLLSIGDDIMKVLVAGRFRTDVLPVFEQLIGRIKKEVVEEKELDQ